MAGQDRWDDSDDQQGRYPQRRPRETRQRDYDDDANFGAPYGGERPYRPALTRGPGAMNSGADPGASGRGYDDFESRAPYGGYGGGGGYATGGGRRPEPRSYREHLQQREGVYGPTWREAEANRELFRSEEAIEHGGFPYGDLARRTGSFGAGGGYAADPNEGYPRRGGRDFWDRASDEVASWFGDRGAEHRRAADVAESHRGRGPKGYQRSDPRINEDVNDRLTDDAWLDAREISVEVQSGEVTLNGTVPDRHSKRRAEDIADSVSGVKHVQNNLRVSEASRPGTVAFQTDPRVSAVADPDEAARKAPH